MQKCQWNPNHQNAFSKFYGNNTRCCGLPKTGGTIHLYRISETRAEFFLQIHKSEAEADFEEDDEVDDDVGEANGSVGDLTAVAAAEGEVRLPPVSTSTTQASKAKPVDEGPPIWVTMGEQQWQPYANLDIILLGQSIKLLHFAKFSHF